jgi:hypothetical protein
VGIEQSFARLYVQGNHSPALIAAGGQPVNGAVLNTVQIAENLLPDP